MILAATLTYGLLRRYAYDDALYLILSEELSVGLNPYAYVDNKPPALYAAMAVWFKLFGHNQYSGRLFSWTVMLATTAIIVRILRARLLWQRLAIGLAAYVFLWFCEGSLLMTEAGVALFAAIGLCAVRGRFESPIAQAAAGAAFGVAALFKQPGAALPVAMCAVLLAAAMTRRLDRSVALRAGVSHLAGAGGVIAVAVGIFVYLGVASELWHQAIQGLAYYGRRSSAFETIFLVVRVGWFLVPALVIVGLRIVSGKILKDELLFQFCALGLLSQLPPLVLRPYAHHVMSAVPFIMVILAYDASWLRTIIAPGKNSRRWAAIATAAVLVCIGSTAYLKRASLMSLTHRAQPVTPRELAFQLAQFAPSAADRALFLSRGPLGYHPTAAYYYSGLRPAGPFLFLLGAESDPTDMQRWLDRLPDLVADPATRIVVFDPARRFDPYYHPIREDLSQRIEDALKRHFIHPGEIADPTLWVRSGFAPIKDAAPRRGPFAASVIDGR